jgi:cytochrome P450
MSTLDPAKIEPPDQPLRTLRLLRVLLNNPLKILPQALYRERLLRMSILGQDSIFVMAPDLIRHVLVDEANHFEKGGVVRRLLEPIFGDAIFNADGPRWRWQHHAVAPFFRQDQVRKLVPGMVAAAERTRDRWSSLPPGVEIDVASEMMRTTIDIVLNTLFPGQHTVECDLMEQSFTHYLTPTPWVFALAMLGAPRWVPYPGVQRVRRAVNDLYRILDSLIAEMKHEPANDNDLRSLLTNATDPETGKPMNEWDVRYNILTFIMAGYETTAGALTWTFYLLSVFPEAERRVSSEIASVTQDHPLCAERIEALSYTMQVVQEALRLYPPVALITRAARQDIRLGNEEVRTGTPVYVPAYAVHRHEAYWCRPDEFDPSRFEREAIKARERYTYLPFGAGPRICIGQFFAQLAAPAVLATLLNSFRLELRSGFIPEPRLQVTLRPAPGMPMRLMARRHA